MHASEKENTIRVYHGTNREDVAMETIAVEADGSEHGGDDRRMYAHLFGNPPPDQLGQMAGSRDGAMTCVIGIGANVSIREKRVVEMVELLGDEGKRT